ncbi:MAG: ATP synthase F1 subunit epsilon [Eggerthella lenta]
MAGFMCDIVTPVAKLVSDEVELVVVPGVEGEMGFLKGHAPLVSVLADGEARVKAVGASETVHYALQGGYVEVTDDKVIILADRALPADIDVEQVREQLAGIEGSCPDSPKRRLARRRSRPTRRGATFS